MSFSSPSFKRKCAALDGGAQGLRGRGEGRRSRRLAAWVWLCMVAPLPALADADGMADTLRLHPRLTPSFTFASPTPPGLADVSSPQTDVTLRQSVCAKVTPLYAMPMTVRAAKPLVMPVTYSRVSSDFGTRYHPVRRVKHRHTGIDLVAPLGAPVRVVAQGVVKSIGYERRGFGRYIVIAHRHDSETIYAHLSATARGLRVGETVTAGRVIGAVGKSGMVTGPHLHFELRRQGVPADPRALLRRTARMSESSSGAGNPCLNVLNGVPSWHLHGGAGAVARWQYSPL
ncbi:Glycyl-glycine endopeptidase ALE-1 [Pandoraea eparura]|jgi:murein DD-endopeptidase MepM/ murein hydrolase activator NlpD|uniref:Glycyl-glycine endopeptidase ALE-1 n=1 Tax=Pandoraea eparura TaxID=2508291 RepID=A0A5E4TW78_9BURK|nr:M23 family metallopeptidase [Pandoraea eparura]VVD91482.1 Glycyl-glycine endopeptidase ALE-1 [Pandoraea eparura]